VADAAIRDFFGAFGAVEVPAISSLLEGNRQRPVLGADLQDHAIGSVWHERMLLFIQRSEAFARLSIGDGITGCDDVLSTRAEHLIEPCRIARPHGLNQIGGGIFGGRKREMLLSTRTTDLHCESEYGKVLPIHRECPPFRLALPRLLAACSEEALLPPESNALPSLEDDEAAGARDVAERSPDDAAEARDAERFEVAERS
jgi:hypothetical protein